MATIPVEPAHTCPEVMNLMKGRTLEALCDELTRLAGGFVLYRQKETGDMFNPRWVLIPDTPWAITLDTMCDETAYAGEDATELVAWVIHGALNLCVTHHPRNDLAQT